MSDDAKCFYEEIGFEIGGALKIWESGCGDDDVHCAAPPPVCPRCKRPTEIAPGCRRCGSTEHTTSYHDAKDAGKDSGTVEIQALSGGDLLRLIISNEREK